MAEPDRSRLGTVKCLVWDLDNTVWDGVLLEGDALRLRPGVEQAIRGLDAQGILHSIASRNDHDAAMCQLEDVGLAEFFVVPQIGWGKKSEALRAIADELNIATQALAFIDDDPYERAEVAHGAPGVLCLPASSVVDLLEMEEFTPRVATAEGKSRRVLYQAEIERVRSQGDLTTEEFNRELQMVFSISDASADDLARLEELTVRTNQLNSTGEVFSYEELDRLRLSDNHRLFVAELDDRFGSYGKVGLALLEYREEVIVVRLLLMSCRVMSRGVGRVLLSFIAGEADRLGMALEARFVRTQRNRPMYLTFKLAGFRDRQRDGDTVVLRHDGAVRDPYPGHIEVRTPV